MERVLSMRARYMKIFLADIADMIKEARNEDPSAFKDMMKEQW